MIRRTRFRLFAAAVAMLAGLAVATPATAQQGPEVVASGLDNPRGLGFAPDGQLYVAEAGRGGDGPCFAGPEGPSCFGPSGAVTKINLNRGEWRRVLTGLPSFAGEGTGAAAIGPMDVAFSGSTGRFVTFGLGANPAVRTQIPELGDMAQLVRTQFMQNHWDTVADIGDFESSVDPNADGPDSNPVGLIASSAGQVLTDAGGNALLSVDKRGQVSTIATFPNRLVPGPGPGGMFSMDEVPTSVAVGPGGGYYVGQLTGFPFPVGGARVYRIVGGQPQVYASGFTNIIDIGFGARGELYVLEIFTNGLLSGDPTGALKRVNRDGTVDLITDDLHTPGGLAIMGKNVYVSDCGTCAGGGRVLRINVG